jgi:hypothetical protein
MPRKRIYKSRQTVAVETSPRAAAKRFGIRALNAVIAVGIVGLLVGYLGLTTQSAAKGFVLRGIEQKMAEMRAEGERLEVDVAGKQAMQNVSGEVDKYGFVPVAGIQYVSENGGTVAVK